MKKTMRDRLIGKEVYLWPAPIVDGKGGLRNFIGRWKVSEGSMKDTLRLKNTRSDDEFTLGMDKIRERQIGVDGHEHLILKAQIIRGEDGFYDLPFLSSPRRPLRHFTQLVGGLVNGMCIAGGPWENEKYSVRVGEKWLKYVGWREQIDVENGRVVHVYRFAGEDKDQRP